MKKLFIIILLSSLFIFVGNNKATASHFAGADLTYTCLGGNTYQITLSFYRDCSGVNAPTTAGIMFNCASNSTLNFTSQMPQIPGTGIEITQACNAQPTSCTTGPNSQYGIREYVYSATVTLQACGDWTMSWSSCCRNPITTINGSGGWYVSAMLNNANAPCNSSPIFTNKPIIQAFNNQSFSYSQGAIDMDGDSLSYSFFNPKTSANTTVTYNSPYSYTNFLSSSTPITIDSVNGDVSFTPNLILNTICAIKVEEWRTINGIPTLIGIIHRDVQLNVINSLNQIPILSGIDTSLSHTYNINDTTYSIEKCFANSPITFHINGYDADTFNASITGHPEKFSISWNSGIPSATFTPFYNGTDSAYAQFSWSPNSSDVNMKKCFTATIIDDACAYSGVQSYSYCITARGMLVDIGSDTMLCEGETTTINANADSSTINYLWSINGIPAGVPYNQDSIIINSSNLGSGQHIISIETNDGATTSVCPGVDAVTIDVVYQPNIHGTMPDTSFCSNATIVYDAGQGYLYSWTTLPSGMPAGNTQTLQINNSWSSWTYRIEVDGGNHTRCIDVDTFIVLVYPVPPIVDFGNDTTISNNQTLNLSLPSGYTDYSWSTGAITQSIVIDSTYNWANSIIGTVTTNNQCFSTDTIIVYIGSVGFNENSEDKVQIFPNPVSNNLNIELKKDNKETKIRIHNINGQLIRTETFNGKNHEVKSLEGLENGVYILYLSNSDINVIMKFVKE